jgi:hypothetical protein
MREFLVVIVMFFLAVVTIGCGTNAQIASYNLSKAAD